MRKFLSILLAVLMVVAIVPATVAFAEEAEPTGTITAFQKVGESYVQVEGTFSTIDTAANAAGTNGKIELSAGKFEFNGRQTIAVNGITLIGAVDATTGKPASHFVTGPNFGTSSEPNRKALFCVAASDVTVTNIAFDGGEYGRTLVPTTEAITKFSVVRINSGSAVFDNVSIVQSTRTLLTIGTSSTTASLTAEDLYCTGNDKTIPSTINWNVYADIDVENGTFSCTSGELDAFLQVNKSTGNVTNMPAYHYTLDKHLFSIIELVNVKTTAKHFADAYIYIYTQGGSAYSENINEFSDIVVENVNTEIATMVDDICDNPNYFGSTTINNLIALFTDVVAHTSSRTAKPILNGYIARLEALHPAN